MKSIRAEPAGFSHRLLVEVGAARHDDRQRRPAGANLFQQPQAIVYRHHHVGDDGERHLPRDVIDRIVRTLDGDRLDSPGS